MIEVRAVGCILIGPVFGLSLDIANNALQSYSFKKPGCRTCQSERAHARTIVIPRTDGALIGVARIRSGLRRERNCAPPISLP